MRRTVLGIGGVLLIGGGLVLAGGGGAQIQVPATLQDYFAPGTQPFEFTGEDPPDVLFSATDKCVFCHGDYAPDHAPFELWKTSMMAQAGRDPLFHAALAVAEQDSAFSGELCLRCHAPKAWLEGRSTPSNGSALIGTDFEGVGCSICHRMIDPVYEAGVSPMVDAAQLALIDPLPPNPHNGQFIIDRRDRRRGPFDLGQFFFHEWLQSAFHRESALCATCHEVSNPLLVRNGGAVPSAADTYDLAPLDTPHPTLDKYDQFPEQRTYSEWLGSAFATGPIDLGGRFGGNNPLVSSCQDCHMPDTTGTGCSPFLTDVVRDDLPMHSFAGVATWILDAILELDQSLALYDEDAVSGLTPEDVELAQTRNRAMLQAAADLSAAVVDIDRLQVRVTNYSGHKLPTGYPEGRRMWINLQLAAADGTPLVEHGAYDAESAELDGSTTTVFEAKFGMDAAIAGATGLSAGQSFHLVLNNVILHDNRIPPLGYTQAAFEAMQAAPVGAAYADGQHWHDTLYDIPCDAATATARLYYQQVSHEYVQFLRDANFTSDRGQLLYDLWEATGRGAPVEMAAVVFELPDCNANGVFDGCDVLSGTSQDADGNGIPDECAIAPLLVASIPPDGAIDARQPHAIDDADASQGWTTLRLTFDDSPATLMPADFSLSGDTAPSITAATVEGNDVVLTLSAPLPAGVWTTLTYMPGATTRRWGVLPADVNADRLSNPLDILALIDVINGVLARPEWSTDINRSGIVEPLDILRVIDLLNGADAFEPWLGATLPE